MTSADKYESRKENAGEEQSIIDEEVARRALIESNHAQEYFVTGPLSCIPLSSNNEFVDLYFGGIPGEDPQANYRYTRDGRLWKEQESADGDQWIEID